MHRCRGLVDLPPAQFLPAAAGTLHEVHRGVACGGDCLERLCITLRHGRPGKSHPGNVSKHRARRVQFAPEVEQHQIARPNRAMRARRRQVMRVAGVLGGGHVRCGVADEPLVDEPLRHQLLDVVLGRRHAVARAFRDRRECAILHPVEPFGSATMTVDRTRAPGGRKALDEIARRDDIDARLPNQLHRAGVDSRDVGNCAVAANTPWQPAACR